MPESGIPEATPAGEGRRGVAQGTVLAIGAGDVEARVALRGAELVSWRVGGEELLWQGDPASWHEQSPVLFPVVGWTRNGESRVHGRTIPLALHGFARHRDFTLLEHGPAHVKLGLKHDEATRALYPFSFSLTLEYSVGAEGLEAVAEVTNTGGEPMPYALGLHPGFRWPFDPARAGQALAAGQAGHWVEFAQAEKGEVPLIAPGGLLAAASRPVPLQGGRILPLDPSLFKGDAMIFRYAASRSIRFCDGRSALVFGFENFPTIVLWMRPGAAFLCIEGWCGSGDPEGFTGDLFEKPDMTILQPAASGRHAMTFGKITIVG
jgi:galactose mutarotase-like enzyme